MKKNPHVAAFFGLLFSFFAYLYVWNLGRFFIVMSAYVMASYFSGLIGSLIVSLAVSFIFSVFVSYDCWRIVKLESKEITPEKAKVVTTQKDKVEQVPVPKDKVGPVTVPRDIYCPNCKIGLALPYPKCPSCGAPTGITVQPAGR